jgi:Right handed beta helix region
MCGNTTLLGGPKAAPAGATTVPAGDDSAVLGLQLAAGETYWFAPGVHTLGAGIYSQIIPQDGDTFMGAPGAVINGQGINDYAFDGNATGVTVEYLTIENFGQTGGNNNQGVVNHDSATGWTVRYDTITGNAGAGVMLGSDNHLSYDCLSSNGQYGLSAYSPNGVTNVTVSDNEIAGNDTYNWEAHDPGCGCTGGGKFWATTDATVVDNYVHDNESVGLWVDTNNAGFQFSGNYFSHNWSSAIIYEISYNAVIQNNTFVDNGLVLGPKNPGFPTGAIYVSESGGDSRVQSNYSGTFRISDNVFTDNWSGVVLWENANRYCSDGSDHVCTLVDPAVYTLSSCAANLPASTPTGIPNYFNGCRWKTQNVTVKDNILKFAPADIGSSCSAKTGCGYMALFSEYGSFPPFKAWVVPNNISNHQNNSFTDNSYSGPWSFVGFNQGNVLTWSQWTKGESDANGSGYPFKAQDAGSTYSPA